MRQTSKAIYLLPTSIGDSNTNLFTGGYLMKYYSEIHAYICENEKAARAFFKSIGTPIPQDKLRFLPTSKGNLNTTEIKTFLKENESGPIGLISDAGLPCIADPGNKAVQVAIRLGFEVYPTVGPSSILMALMASGCNGQHFAFNGYLPIKDPEKKQAIRGLQEKIRKNKETQIFIETPYRNDQMLKSLTRFCAPELILSISVNLMSKDEYTKTHSIKEWSKLGHEIGKTPCVFVLGSHH